MALIRFGIQKRKFSLFFLFSFLVFKEPIVPCFVVALIRRTTDDEKRQLSIWAVALIAPGDSIDWRTGKIKLFFSPLFFRFFFLQFGGKSKERQLPRLFAVALIRIFYDLMDVPKLGGAHISPIFSDFEERQLPHRLAVALMRWMPGRMLGILFCFRRNPNLSSNRKRRKHVSESECKFYS